MARAIASPRRSRAFSLPTFLANTMSIPSPALPQRAGSRASSSVAAVVPVFASAMAGRVRGGARQVDVFSDSWVGRVDQDDGTGRVGVVSGSTSTGVQAGLLVGWGD